MFSRINLPPNSACRLTPAGPGAVAVLQLEISEPHHADRILSCFESRVPGFPGQTNESTPVNRILFGQWRGEEVLLIRTALHRWELHCHGGTAAVDRILQDLADAGLPTAAPVWSSQSSMSIPLAERIELAVQHALADCRTQLAADWILRQLDGRLLAPLTMLGSADPEIHRAAREELLRHQAFLSLLLRPLRIGLFGPPNAGKSSLLNALCGRGRAIVSPIAGTTRDPVEAETQAAGRVLCVIDTAGLHDSPDSALEAHGIQRTRGLVNTCDAACVLAPADQPLPDLQELAAPFSSCPIRILVRSRCDLLDPHDTGRSTGMGTEVLPYFTREIFVSAVTGTGLQELREAVLEALAATEPEPDAALPLPGLLD